MHPGALYESVSRDTLVQMLHNLCFRHTWDQPTRQSDQFSLGLFLACRSYTAGPKSVAAMGDAATSANTDIYHHLPGCRGPGHNRPRKLTTIYAPASGSNRVGCRVHCDSENAAASSVRSNRCAEPLAERVCTSHCRVVRMDRNPYGRQPRTLAASSGDSYSHGVRICAEHAGQSPHNCTQRVGFSRGGVPGVPNQWVSHWDPTAARWESSSERAAPLHAAGIRHGQCSSSTSSGVLTAGQLC